MIEYDAHVTSQLADPKQNTTDLGENASRKIKLPANKSVTPPPPPAISPRPRSVNLHFYWSANCL